MRTIAYILVAGLASLAFAAPATADDGTVICVTIPGPDPHQGRGDVCIASLDPSVPPICYYKPQPGPHPPEQQCLT